MSDVEDPLNLRREFGLIEDFEEVWKEKHGFSLEAFADPSTWRYQAVFILAL